MMKEGDVYHWSYKDNLEYHKKHAGSGTAYWCLDQKAFVKEENGEIYLIDTYWQSYDQKYIGSSSHCLDINNVTLEFICNLNDIRFIRDYEKEDYDVVYNISRQKGCYPVYAVDRNAQVSNKALIKKYQYALENAKSDLKSAQRDIEHYTKLISELENINDQTTVD